MRPADARLHALPEIVCRLLVRHDGELIAYGVGSTDPERSSPLTTLPATSPAIPTRSWRPSASALEDPGPLGGITQLTDRLGAAFTVDPDGEGALRASVWEPLRPMLSPALVALSRDAFVIQEESETTVDFAGLDAATSLEGLDLDEVNSTAV